MQVSELRDPKPRNNIADMSLATSWPPWALEARDEGHVSHPHERREHRRHATRPEEEHDPARRRKREAFGSGLGRLTEEIVHSGQLVHETTAIQAWGNMPLAR